MVNYAPEFYTKRETQIQFRYTHLKLDLKWLKSYSYFEFHLEYKENWMHNLQCKDIKDWWREYLKILKFYEYSGKYQDKI